MKHRPVVYRQLAHRIGEGALADALLAKWLADPDADGQWHLLMDAVLDAEPGKPRACSPPRSVLREAA